MKVKIGFIITILTMLVLSGCASGPTPQAGWYPKLVRYDEISKHAVLPRPEDVTIVDARPGKRKYAKGHIPGAINIFDRDFNKMKAKLPSDKGSLLIYYCGGVKCMLSHKSAFKAEKLGYTNIKVYAEGFPNWKKNGGLVAVSIPFLKKQIESKPGIVVVDSRPKKRKYNKGHIPGAISIFDKNFSKMTDKLPADKTTPLYFYCGGYKCKLSTNSAKKAIKLGYKKVRIVPAGYPGWKKAYGKGTTFKAPKVKAGKEDGTISIASFKKIYKTAAETLLLVDVRDSGPFTKGTFKNAKNIPINDLEKRMDELKPGSKTIVFFCGTGGRAGEAYDMMQMFKPKVKTYFLNAEITFNKDGSYAMKKAD